LRKLFEKEICNAVSQATALGEELYLQLLNGHIDYYKVG
jgi:hypothetical protein